MSISETGSTAESLNNIEGWAAEATPEAAARLEALAQTTENKEVRKAARRAIYRLSQRGIVAPREATHVEPAPVTQVGPIRAFATAFDGAGNQLLIFLLPVTDGGVPIVAQILANDEIGIRNVTVERRKNREFAALLEQVEARIDDGFVIAEIEPEYGRALVAHYRSINQRRSTMTPPGFLDLVPRIGVSTEPHRTDQVYEYLPADQVQASQDIPRDPVDLFKRPWFEPWFFAIEQVMPWLERWTAVDSGVVVFAAHLKQDRKRMIAREAATTLLPEETRQRYAARLEISADMLRRRGRELEARQALYHALQLRSETPTGEVPFAVALATRTIEAAAEMAAAAREQEERGIQVRSSIE